MGLESTPATFDKSVNLPVKISLRLPWKKVIALDTWKQKSLANCKAKLPTRSHGQSLDAFWRKLKEDVNKCLV